MRVRNNIYANLRSAKKSCWSLAPAVALLVFSAASVRAAQVKSVSDWIPVSMNAGETYLISDIKPGTHPSFRIAQNPNAFVSYDNSPPGKLTMLSAAAGRWIVTVTNNSDREVSYDLNSFAVSKPGAPMSPGNAPASVNDPGLNSRSQAGASTSISAAMPELATVSAPRSSSSASSYSAALPAPTSSGFNASWSIPAEPGQRAQAYEPSQSVGPLESHVGQYRNDPSVLDSGFAYPGDPFRAESTISRPTPSRS